MMSQPSSRLVALLASVAVVSALALVHSTHRARGQYANLQRLEAERWQLQEDYSRLLLEESTMASPHRVVEVSTGELGMISPPLETLRVVER